MFCLLGKKKSKWGRSHVKYRGKCTFRLQSNQIYTGYFAISFSRLNAISGLELAFPVKGQKIISFLGA